jgi:hypothetical protein
MTSAAKALLPLLYIAASVFLGNIGATENMLRVKLRRGRHFAPSSYVGAEAPTP